MVAVDCESECISSPMQPDSLALADKPLAIRDRASRDQSVTASLRFTDSTCSR